MLRILLFLGTNVAIIALISVTFRLLGLDGILQQNGVDLDMNALLVYSAVIVHVQVHGQEDHGRSADRSTAEQR